MIRRKSPWGTGCNRRCNWNITHDLAYVAVETQCIASLPRRNRHKPGTNPPCNPRVTAPIPPKHTEPPKPVTTNLLSEIIWNIAGYEIISSTIPKIGMRTDSMDNDKILINNNANSINMTCCVLTNPPRTTWKHDISYGSALIAVGNGIQPMW